MAAQAGRLWTSSRVEATRSLGSRLRVCGSPGGFLRGDAGGFSCREVGRGRPAGSGTKQPSVEEFPEVWGREPRDPGDPRFSQQPWSFSRYLIAILDLDPEKFCKLCKGSSPHHVCKAYLSSILSHVKAASPAVQEDLMSTTSRGS